MSNNYDPPATSISSSFATVTDSTATATATATSTTLSVAVVCLLSLLTVSRFGERLSKYLICVIDSAVTFSIVQAARRLSAIYMLALIFHEQFSTSLWIGSILCTIGFGCNIVVSSSSKTAGKPTSTTNTGTTPSISKPTNDQVIQLVVTNQSN